MNPLSDVQFANIFSHSVGCLFFFFSEVGKILFVENLVGEKRRERLHIGECRGTWKPVIPMIQFLNTNLNIGCLFICAEAF
jgi:hypothetical protein